jgi:hypothetical protein
VPDVVAVESAPRSFPGGWAVVAVVVALIGLLLLAGVPGRERVAGNGSEALRHGWASRRAAAAQQPQPAPDASRSDAH